MLKDWVAKNIESVGGGYNFNVHYKGSFFASFRLNMIGLHNITNSLFAIAVAHFCGINKNTIVSGLSSFLGVERRFERIARLDNCSVIIDYAHHPTELINSIEGLSAVYKRILYVFQPHTYTRTLKLFDDFVEVLGSLSDIVIFKTYPAREVEIKGGTAKDLFDALCVPNKQYFDDNLSLIEYLETQKNVFDCILILGAGDLATILKNHYSTH